MVKALHRRHVHRLDPRPLKRPACFRDRGDVPHPLPGIDREARAPQGDKRIAGLVHFRKYMERTPFAGLGRQVFDQMRQIGMIKLRRWGDEEQLGEAIIHSQSGHIQIASRGFLSHGSRSAEKYLIRDVEQEKIRLAALNGVSNVMARINFSGLLNNGRTDFPVVAEGIEPSREESVGSSLVVLDGRYLSDRDEAGLLIGVGVAKALGLKPGDPTTLLVSTPEGGINTLDAEVVGIFQSFSKDYDGRAIKLPLKAAQFLLNTDGANVIVVSLWRTDDTAQVAHVVRDKSRARDLEVKTWDELNDFYSKTVDMYDGFFAVFRLIILMMVLLGVANAVNMSVLERIGEFGTIRALGSRRRDVIALVLTETTMTATIGALVGVALGVMLSLLISSIGIPMPPPPNSNMEYTARIQVVASVIGWAIAIAFAATVAACIPAVLRVSRISIVEALRRNI